MSVLIKSVQLQNNPAPFSSPFSFIITTECVSQVKDDLEWKLIYVGSAESEDFDQVLESVLVGPIPLGVSQFIFEADPPKPERIPPADLIGVTVILLTCSYNGAEFVRIGYYVENEYTEPELRENPPQPPVIEKIQRLVVDSKPRITVFKIPWDDGDKYNFSEFERENQIASNQQEGQQTEEKKENLDKKKAEDEKEDDDELDDEEDEDEDDENEAEEAEEEAEEGANFEKEERKRKTEGLIGEQEVEKKKQKIDLTIEGESELMS